VRIYMAGTDSSREREESEGEEKWLLKDEYFIHFA